MTDRQTEQLIASRLAARMHQRQAKLMRYLIGLGHKLRRLYGEAGDRIAAAAKGTPPKALPARIDKELRGVAREMQRELGAVLLQSARDTAAAVQSSVPQRWLLAYARRRVLPVRERRDAESEAEMQLLLDLERAAELSPEEAKALVQSLLFPMPSPERVEKILSEPGPGGIPWDERLKSWEGKTRGAIRTELTAGLAAGENVDKLRVRLRPLTDGLGYKAQRIARTEGARLAHRANQETYAAMGDAVQAQTIVAVMDEHTRPEHALRNGRTYQRREDGTYRDAAGNVMPDLPDAPNCRCFAVPDLGIPDYLKKDPAARSAYEKATAALVPDPASYADWWQQAKPSERKAAVGAKRFGAVKQRVKREPKWPDFLDPDGKLLTPSEIKAETPDEREQRLRRLKAILDQRRRQYEEVASRGYSTPDTDPGASGRRVA